MSLYGQNIFRFIGLILVLGSLFLGYRFFFLGDKGKEKFGLEPVTPSVSSQTDRFLAILLSLEQIDLEASVFQSKFFRGLVDFSPRLTPQTPGRINPFAPIGRDDRSGRGSSGAATSSDSRGS